MKVGKLKEILSHYSDDAEFVLYNKGMDIEYTNDFYDIWVTGNKDRQYIELPYYQEDNEERSIESTKVSFNIFR